MQTDAFINIYLCGEHVQKSLKQTINMSEWMQPEPKCTPARNIQIIVGEQRSTFVGTKQLSSPRERRMPNSDE